MPGRPQPRAQPKAPHEGPVAPMTLGPRRPVGAFQSTGSTERRRPGRHRARGSRPPCNSKRRWYESRRADSSAEPPPSRERPRASIQGPPAGADSQRVSLGDVSTWFHHPRPWRSFAWKLGLSRHKRGLLSAHQVVPAHSDPSARVMGRGGLIAASRLCLPAFRWIGPKA